MSETSTSSLEESIRAARLQYLDQVNNRLTATMSSADRFVNFAGIIAAATITAGILGNRPLIVILAPYALVIVFAYQVQLYTDAERFTVLLEHLEAQLNGNFYEGIFCTARVLDRRYRNRWSVKGMQVFYALIATGAAP